MKCLHFNSKIMFWLLIHEWCNLLLFCQCWRWVCSAWCLKKSPNTFWITSPPKNGEIKPSSKVFIPLHALSRNAPWNTTDTWVFYSTLSFVKLFLLLWAGMSFFYIFYFILTIYFVLYILGLLYKRCTLLLPTKDRLKLIFSKFSQVRKRICVNTSKERKWITKLVRSFVCSRIKETAKHFPA